jgi:hypothetical protein
VLAALTRFAARISGRRMGGTSVVSILADGRAEEGGDEVVVAEGELALHERLGDLEVGLVPAMTSSS